MMKIKFFLTSAASLLAGLVMAQKLPNKQTASIWTGADIKIDGRLKEKGTAFQAFNAAVGAYYTMSNDDDFLYLTLQPSDPSIIKRVVHGGVTLTVKSLDKQAGPSVSVAYPAYEAKSPHMVYTYRVEVNRVLIKAPVTLYDSLAKVNNDRMAQTAKVIRVAGIEGVDSLISIYNEHNIKAVGGFDNKLNYIYELAIPIKHVETLLSDDKKINYQVKINGVIESGVYRGYNDSGQLTVETIKPGGVWGQDATDFWGEYTLAKKPFKRIENIESGIKTIESK